MFGNNKRWPAPVLAMALAALVALAGCRKDPSVASRSAAAFREAEKKGATFAGAGSHGHGALTPGAGEEQSGMAGMDMGGTGHSGMAGMGRMKMGGKGPSGMSGMDMGSKDHSGMAGMDMGGTSHSGMAGMGGMKMGGKGPSGMSGMDMGSKDHSGMAGMDMGSTGHSGMAGMGGMKMGGKGPSGMSGMDMGGKNPAAGPPAVAAPVSASPGQPAKTLSSDPLDSPAATSVLDARRSAEMAQAMSGGMSGMEGMSGMGGSTYHQVDAGRGPGAYEGSEKQTPGAGLQHDQAVPPSVEEREPSHAHAAGAAQEAADYTCPMHPEVSSKTPGKCPKCGMTLVKRRKG